MWGSRYAFLRLREETVMVVTGIGGFFFRYSPKNHAGSKFVDPTLIARDGKLMR